MMNDDMLRNIEYLREKADVSYEDAQTLLERFDGNVMRVLVELERQGRVYPQGGGAAEYTTTSSTHTQQDSGKQKKEDVKGKATGFINKAFEYRLVVENVNGEEKETVANLSAPYCAGAAIIAPHLAMASVGLMFVLGYRVKIKRKKAGKLPEDVETFVDKTVSNIKKTASSFGETVRGEKVVENKDADDHDEGGEITVD